MASAVAVLWTIAWPTKRCGRWATNYPRERLRSWSSSNGTQSMRFRRRARHWTSARSVSVIYSTKRQLLTSTKVSILVSFGPIAQRYGSSACGTRFRSHSQPRCGAAARGISWAHISQAWRGKTIADTIFQKFLTTVSSRKRRLRMKHRTRNPINSRSLGFKMKWIHGNVHGHVADGRITVMSFSIQTHKN